jgi:Ser/Thr protein kinase RdoA (MazF antagonist)
MNHTQLTKLCKAFELGTPINVPQKVLGGLLHIMWRINTDKGSYAVKQLSPDIDLRNETIIKNYNLTEEIASRFLEHEIPAISAIKHAGKYLTLIDGIGFLIYPWVDAQPIHHDTASEFHALQIAKMLAKIHFINLDIPEIAEPEFDVHSNDTLTELIRQANSCKCIFAPALNKLENDITAININYQNTLPLLKKHVIISHGDLDQKNVLWDKSGNPILIDWECARKLNPTHEIVDASLNWSGIATNFDKTLFTKMMQTYSMAGGRLNKNLLQAAFNGVLGNWINWMVYNIKRACVKQESEQKTLGIEQVNQVLITITTLKNIIPDLMTSLTK